MIITKETDYALRALRALAGDTKQKVSELAKNNQIPVQYLYKIAQKLQEAGLVENSRGPSGGISLACDLKKTTLLDVVNCMEPETNICPCTKEGYECLWVKEHGECLTHNYLCQIQQELNARFAAVSLWNLFFDQTGKDENHAVSDLRKT